MHASGCRQQRPQSLEGRHFKTAEAKRHTLADLIDRYIVDILPHKGASAIRKQTQQLLWWKARLGYCIVADITPALIAEHRDMLRRDPTPRHTRRSNATVNHYLAALSHVFTIAVKEWHWYDDNPVHKITKPRLPRGRVRFLSDEERLRLLAACQTSRNPSLYPIVVLALATGARRAFASCCVCPLASVATGIVRAVSFSMGLF